MSHRKADTSRVHPRNVERGFTLIELLVVIGVLALLLSVLLPSLSAARRHVHVVACRSNIREIMIANGYYRDDNDGVYVPGAADFRYRDEPGYVENLKRWHGERDHKNDPFDACRGPLVPYLGAEGEIRQCQAFPVEDLAHDGRGFERGNGGYGYNNGFVGSQVAGGPGGTYEVVNDRAGAQASRIRRPAATIMFTDSAFAGKTLIEYSFAEPRFLLDNTTFRFTPSIHFRHNGLANVGWCDGHVDAHAMTFTHNSGMYRSDPKSFDIGWFGQADDNSLFDLH